MSLAVFAWIELRGTRAPLVDLRLFTNQTFASAVSVSWSSAVALFATEFLFPIYLQSVRGMKAEASGALMVPIALGAGFVLPVAGKLYERTGPRALVIAGFALLTVNTWGMARLAEDTSKLTLVCLAALRGFAIGLTAQTTFVAAASVIAPERMARGTSLIVGTRHVAQSLGVALVALVCSTRLSPGPRAALDRTRRRRAPARAAGDFRPKARELKAALEKRERHCKLARRPIRSALPEPD